MPRGKLPKPEALDALPTDVRTLALEFGRIFHLWPPSSKGGRARWIKELRECKTTGDERDERINPVPIWETIAREDRFTVASPGSTLKAVRARHAKNLRQKEGEVVPPKGWS